MHVLPFRRRATAPTQGDALHARLTSFDIIVAVNGEIVRHPVTAASAYDARRQYLRTMGRREAIVRIEPR